jgi:hypothetical protein
MLMVDSTLLWRDNNYSLIEEFIMPKIVDRTGERFGKLVVLGLAGKQGNDRKCKVRCDCGVEKEIVQSKLTTKTKPVKSCGCLAKENHYRTHGRTNHKWYSVWNGMIGRCHRESNSSFEGYGKRGITVCDEWRSDPSVFFEWLEENDYRKYTQIDRINNDAGYSPDNCRVTTRKVNCNNRRDNKKYTIDNERLTIAQMSEKYDIKYGTLYKRLKLASWSVEDAIHKNIGQQVVPARSKLCPS